MPEGKQRRVLRTLLPGLAPNGVDTRLMQPSPAELSLIYVSFSVITLYAPALLVAFLLYFFLARRSTRLARRVERQHRVREKIAAEGLATRKRLAYTCQRNNIRELAGLVKSQLEQRKRKMTPYMHQRTSVFIDKAVTAVDFDRLYALHALFATATDQQVSPAMESFFAEER